ncbi:recombinase family protein [Spirulina subsalsa FACHB-351]|uniref:Recombinase family protein n=1 Tax=Spirulina subsalsa FACHB-351 TaxID=234711 RepID=A0ABT3L2J9_9CYAN|nr:recombinase family protein [Spirulina subsalsa]MCW6035412.1 recombinase family protein [Spirulina subsalsa FACHB-351]
MSDLKPLWISGITRSGKTQRLVQEFRRWVTQQEAWAGAKTPGGLVLAANDDNRRVLAEQLSQAIAGRYPIYSKTPLGFVTDEVVLFWPLLFEELQIKAQFPLRLRPEMEQTLATRLWHPKLVQQDLGGMSEARFVRETLDILQLASASGIPYEDIPQMLTRGLVGEEWKYQPEASQLRGELLEEWRKWCLDRGLLSYGILYELYWRYLLPHPTYEHHLKRRYQGIFADDLDDYPAIARDFIESLLNHGAWGVFTYNPQGQVRLGLNADPNYLLGLSTRCQVKQFPPPPGLAADWADAMVGTALGQESIPPLPPSVTSLQTISRSSLLGQTANAIAQAVGEKQVQPSEIAVIAPGLDAIARYTLISLLTQHGIPVEPLNEQRPLISEPSIRALLTLLPFFYPHLGHWVERDGVAEMLVVLSGAGNPAHSIIDPIRAGLLADYCYYPNSEQPQLRPATTYPRWDRLGHRALNAYEEIRQWLQETQQKQPGVKTIIFLDQALHHFFLDRASLPFSQLAALRELMETAQHFWQVERRLHQHEPLSGNSDAIARFIQLLRQGTISANPYPLRPWGMTQPNAVTLATIFQYRSLRRSHPWHFWLDVGSNLWAKSGSAGLFGAPIFLRHWSGTQWSPEEEAQADKERLERLLRDLLGRVEKHLILCHSDLAVTGTEQMGPLLSLVYGAMENP